MIELSVNRPDRKLYEIPATLRSEGELNAFMERMADDYENNPGSEIDDVTAARTFNAAKTQLNLLRFRGPA